MNPEEMCFLVRNSNLDPWECAEKSSVTVVNGTVTFFGRSIDGSSGVSAMGIGVAPFIGSVPVSGRETGVTEEDPRDEIILVGSFPWYWALVPTISLVTSLLVAGCHNWRWQRRRKAMDDIVSPTK